MNSRLAERSILLLSIAAIGCRPDEGGAIRGRAGDGDGAAIVAAGPGMMETRARVEALRRRFRVPVAPARPDPRQPRTTAPAGERSALADPLARGFVARRGGLAPVLPEALPEAPGGLSPSTAEVLLGATASAAFRVTHARSGVSIEATLEGARPAPAVAVDGYLFYGGALEGADLIQRPSESGTEDHLAFAARPPQERIAYRLRLGEGVAGLRLVDHQLSLLDASGTPRLRMARPFLVDGAGRRLAARVRVAGCAVDESPAGPWQRAPIDPGGRACTIEIDWSEAAAVYPALLDPAWTTTSKMDFSGSNMPVVPLPGGKVLVTSESLACDLFDPATLTFTATGPTAAMHNVVPATRLTDGTVLVAGGGANLVIAERYDPAFGTWRATGNLNLGRYWHTATLLPNGKVLIAAGTSCAAGCNVLSSAEVYDPANGQFTSTGSLGTARSLHTAALLPNGTVLIAGGHNYIAGAVSTLGAAEIYDPAMGSFKPTGGLSITRYQHVMARLGNGKVMVAGGEQIQAGGGLGTILDGIEVYDPAFGNFVAVGALTSPRASAVAGVLPSGQAMVAGGFADEQLTTLTSVDLFDPVTQAVTAGVPMNEARAYADSAVLPDGRYLVAGGGPHVTNFGWTFLDTAEIYGTGLLNGNPCMHDADCQSGFCVNGACCNRACTGQCEACNVLMHGGTCMPVTGTPVGARPACPGDGSICNGACDGTGPACQFPGAAVSCRAPTCAGTVSTPGASCDGAGHCPPSVPIDCSPLACSGGACLDACVEDADCAGGNYCDASRHCSPLLPGGAPCTGPNACTTGHCADGVCCDAACADPCGSCNLPDHPGHCVPVKGPPVGARACAGSGACAGSCDGTHFTCAWPAAGASCGAAQCTNGIATAPSTCDGKGACIAGAAVPCAAGCIGTACAPPRTGGCGCHVAARQSPGTGALVALTLLCIALLRRGPRRIAARN